MEVDLFPLFNGYQGWMKTPRWKTYRHELRWQAQQEARADQEAEDRDKAAEREREAERLRGNAR